MEKDTFVFVGIIKDEVEHGSVFNYVPTRVEKATLYRGENALPDFETFDDCDTWCKNNPRIYIDGKSIPVEDYQGTFVRLSTVIYSHLNDLMVNREDLNFDKRMNFVKYLIKTYPNTDINIDPDVEWVNWEFKTKE